MINRMIDLTFAVLIALCVATAFAYGQGGNGGDGGNFGNGRGMSGSCVCGDGNYMNLHTGVVINADGATTSGPIGSGGGGGAVDSHTGQVNGGGTGSAGGGLTAGGPR